MGDAPKAPETIAGRYHVERPIGRGGMGTVWLCRDERLSRDVAVKQVGVLPGETAPDLARAMREARSSAALNHPHVVSVYDVVEEDDQIWLVMEYVPSRTLAQVIAEDGPLVPEAAVVIGAQIAEALATTHAAGTVHRDVKPGNILVTRDQVAKISDFGIARARDHDQLTTSGVLSGTPAYLSPELARGGDPTPAADVWALGATLYAAVEGRPPYDEQPNNLALLATIASSPPTPSEHAGFLTEPIERMLALDPAHRWSMSHAANVLRRLQERYAGTPVGDPTTELMAPRSSAPVAAAPIPAAEEALAEADDQHSLPPAVREESRRRRGPGVLAAVLAALLVLAAVGGFLLLGHQSGGSPSAVDHRHSSSPKVHDQSKHSSSTSGPTPSTTPSGPATPPPAPVSGASAQQFARSYYAALPTDTRDAWASLSSAFQARIGGYGNYQGFWSTITQLSVDATRAAGNRAVDVSLTYVRNDGGRESETRRLFLTRSGSSYLISGDAVVS
ncbi:serine/threonine-protein kinase [Nocardioides cynanchi]|uniref:serine/threonine-protein kinase n=1 Tax=Nocardioides cynanchi TaxID=2558918 RepID=UPI0012493E1A|nr:serine/threonine-protein kinase [Nocardioides cynanchi]